MRVRVPRRGQTAATFPIASILALTAAGLLFIASPSLAGTKYQNSVVPDVTPGEYALTKPGKVALKESAKAGAAGAEIQLVLSKVDCPAVTHLTGAGTCSGSGQACTANGDCSAGVCLGNDGGKPGLCNDVDHVLEIEVEFATLINEVGILFDLQKGKAAFQATGKNKVTAFQVFGPLASSFIGNSVGVGFVRVHGPGTDKSKCSGIACFIGSPLNNFCNNPNPCTDGELYGLAGIVGGADPSPGACSSDAQCAVSQSCQAGFCEVEPCSQDTDCRSFTGAGSTIACNEAISECCPVGHIPACDID